MPTSIPLPAYILFADTLTFAMELILSPPSLKENIKAAFLSPIHSSSFVVSLPPKSKDCFGKVMAFSFCISVSSRAVSHGFVPQSNFEKCPPNSFDG